MNAKEALKNLTEYLTGSMCDCSAEIVSLKTALNRLEELEKVLKIIKDKNVHISCIGVCKSYITYNDPRFCRKPLTETEFNLLKEYLK